VVVVGLVAVGAANPAGAGPPRFDEGSGLPAVGNFTNVTLNGTPQLTTATIAPFVVIDDSGSLAGWNVTLLLPNFANGSGADCSTGATATLSAASASMNPPVVTAANPQTSMDGVTSAGFTDFTTPRKIVRAAAGYGEGTYTVSPQVLKFLVPETARADAYCTQATIAITSGP
jgi:hypothetical protein